MQRRVAHVVGHVGVANLAEVNHEFADVDGAAVVGVDGVQAQLSRSRADFLLRLEIHPGPEGGELAGGGGQCLRQGRARPELGVVLLAADRRVLEVTHHLRRRLPFAGRHYCRTAASKNSDHVVMGGF